MRLDIHIDSILASQRSFCFMINNVANHKLTIPILLPYHTDTEKSYGDIWYNLDDHRQIVFLTNNCYAICK